MVTTILSDEVISSTEFRNNQSRWFNKAYVSPISIMNGKKLLVLLNREYAKNMHQLNNYARLVVQFCQEQSIGRGGKSDVFPWVKHLDEKAIAEFHKELLSTFNDALCGGDSSILEEVLNDWEATAKVASNPELSERLMEKDDPSKYVPVKG